jgi:hypothetical protein
VEEGWGNIGNRSWLSCCLVSSCMLVLPGSGVGSGELKVFGFFVPGYTPGTPYKVSCSPTSGAVPPYSSSPNPYQTAVYPVRSAYPQQSPYAQVCLGTPCTGEGGLVPSGVHSRGTLWQLSLFSPQQGTYYTQPLYAAPPHVIHHTTVVQPNGMPATVYPAPIPPPRGNGVTMGMVAGTTMAMSAGEFLFLGPCSSCVCSTAA